MSLILVDTTVLSNFAHTGRPDLLRRAFPALGVPGAVRAELSTGERLGRVPVCDWSWLGLVELSQSERLRAADFEKVLQEGEAACLAIAEARGGFILTDDSAARRLAGTVGLEVSGTLGALKKLVEEEVLSLSQAEALLSEMMAQGYRSPVRSLREVIP